MSLQFTLCYRPHGKPRWSCTSGYNSITDADNAYFKYREYYENKKYEHLPDSRIFPFYKNTPLFLQWMCIKFNLSTISSVDIDAKTSEKWHHFSDDI